MSLNPAKITPDLSNHPLRRYIERNPVVLKEMRSAMRGWRAFLIITIYLALMGGLVGLVYMVFASTNDVSMTSTANQGLGKTVFGIIFGMELMMVSFVSPALTAGALASEREHQTYDLLRTTLLPPRTLIEGKLISAVLFLLILLLLGLPLQALAFLFGGISIEEVLIAFLMLAISTVVFSAIGLFVSSFMKTTLMSTVLSYIISIIYMSIVPVLVVILTAFLGVISSSNLGQAQIEMLEVVLFVIGYALVSINPATAAVASEVLLLSEQELIYTNIPLPYSGAQFFVISPWIPYILFTALVSLLLIRLSIRMVRRAEK